MEFDFSKLKGRIVEHFGTFARFAEAMGLSKPQLHNRLTNSTDFRPEEVIRAVELLDIHPSDIHIYFFTPKVR